MPQPNLVPGRPATSRTAHSRGMLGSASSVVDLPLSVNDVDMDDSASSGLPAWLRAREFYKISRKARVENYGDQSSRNRNVSVKKIHHQSSVRFSPGNSASLKPN